jgi:hypothetical protein
MGQPAHPKAQASTQPAIHEPLILLRNSERATWRRCRLRWVWTYDKRLAPPREKGALSFGTLIHAALELRYPPGRKRGPHPAITFRELYNAQDHDFSQWDEEGNKVDALELGVAMLETYVNEYGNDDKIEVIHPEQSIQIDVHDKQGNYICTWVGTVDAVYYDLARSTRRRRVVGLLDHKTAKTISEDVSVISSYGEQGISYLWAAEYWLHDQDILPAGEHVDHIFFNWLRKAMPDTRPKNAAGHYLNNPSKDVLWQACEDRHLVVPKKAVIAELMEALRKVGVDPMQLGEPSKRQSKPLLWRSTLDVSQRSLDEINRRIRAEAWEIAQFRAGKLPLTKNPTRDCSWDCSFKEVCELHEMGADYESMLELEFSTWDPYESHELALENT